MAKEGVGNEQKEQSERNERNKRSEPSQQGVYGVQTVLVRNQFYWENYQKIVVLVFLLIILIIMQLGFIIYQQKTPPTPKYFAATPDGVPILIVPLNQPLQTPEFVLDWAKKVVVEIYSLDFLTYRKTLQDDAAFFTWQGHMAFLSSYKASNNLEAVKEKKQVVSVKVTGEGQVVFAGQRSSDRPYSWELNFPVTFTYQNSENEIINQSGTILMTVERDSTLRHAEGIAIAQLIFEAA